MIPGAAREQLADADDDDANGLDVRLVDLKSLTWSQGGAPIGRHTTCESDTDCVQECFRWQNDDARFAVPDFRCDRRKRQCEGIDAASMVHATGQLFFDRLLRPHWHTMPAELRSDVEYWLKRMHSAQRGKRPSTRKLLEKWSEFYRSFDLHKCAAQQRTQADELYQRVLTDEIERGERRCATERYC